MAVSFHLFREPDVSLKTCEAALALLNLPRLKIGGFPRSNRGIPGLNSRNFGLPRIRGRGSPWAVGPTACRIRGGPLIRTTPQITVVQATSGFAPDPCRQAALLLFTLPNDDWYVVAALYRTARTPSRRREGLPNRFGAYPAGDKCLNRKLRPIPKVPM